MKWVQIPGFPLYEISDTGEVRSYNKRGKRAAAPRLIKLKRKPNGYYCVSLSRNGVDVYPHVHRLVLQAFVGSCPDGMEAAHLNGIRSDNRLENLQWTTRKENRAHKKLHGTEPVGELRWNSKLTDDEVRLIRKLHAQGVTPYYIAKNYISKVDRNAIRAVLDGRTWAHVQ